MAKHPKRRALRLRRTIDPQTGLDGAGQLRRALWGVPEREAAKILEEQDQALARQAAELERETAVTVAEVQRLQDQVEQQKRQLANVRRVVELLRTKLATERAARSVLAARLLERKAEEEKMAAEGAFLQTVRTSADIQQEHESLRQLIAVLYRSIAGKAGVPLNLEVMADIPVTTPTAGSVLRGPTVDPNKTWQRFLVGKQLTQSIVAADGRTILYAGETLGPDQIAMAHEEGLLFELILSTRVPERIPDL